MKGGTIYLCQFPFTDGTGAKVRPVLVVSHEQYNRGEDVVVVPISSRVDPRDPFSVVVANDAPEFASTMLKQSSAVKWAKPFTLSKRLLLRRLGHLDDSLLGEVITKLAQLFQGNST